MIRLFKSLSLAPRGIRHKLTMAFALMSIIPILVGGYLIRYYIFPTVKNFGEVSLICLITIVLVLLGFYLAQKLIYPIIEITAHAKGVAEGKLDRVLRIDREDEIGELSGSLNYLSTRLKENMSELHSYGEKIKQINMEINKKMFALSGLLQIGNLMTASANIDEVFDLIVGKLAQLQPGGAAFLMLLDPKTGQLVTRAQTNTLEKEIESVKVRIGQGALGKIWENSRPLIMDTQRKLKTDDEDLAKVLPTKNAVVLPISSYGKVIGLLGTGNNIINFLFSDDEIELIGVFAKQAAVAIENDALLRKTEELTVRDELTGLYNEGYIRNRLSEEIKRAITYQRPCSLIILEIDNFKQYHEVQGEIVAEMTLKKIAKTLKDSTTDIEKSARFSDHQFAVVLPEKNKQQACSLVENIKKEIERFGLRQEKLEPNAPLRIVGGISATPIDGTTSVELINQALKYVEQAKHDVLDGIVF